MKALRPTNIPFPSTGSFTRASTATYIEDGVLKTAAINEPRWQNGDLLLETSSTNILQRSEEFENTYWFKSSFTTVSANTTTSPTGDSTADKLVEGNSASVAPYVGRSGTVTVVGQTYTFSFFAKAAEREWAYCAFINEFGAGKRVYFNLVSGTVGNVGSGVISSGIYAVGNGWFRCHMTVVAGSTTPLPSIGMTLTNGGNFYTGNGTSGMFIWGAQLEVSETMTSYIKTVSASASRSADVVTGTGLIYTNATDARPLWSSSTTYSIGQVIRYNNIVYESLQNTNLNKQPDTNPTWWLNLGADNISAAFDSKVGTKTTATNRLRMIIKPNTVIDSVGYIETVASTLTTSVFDETNSLIYSQKTSLDAAVIEDWYDYFFLDPLGDPLTQVVHQGISTINPGLIIAVELYRSGTVELGVFVTGQTTNIGKTQYGLRAGIVDYSKKEADEFGNVTIVERAYSKRLEGDVYVNNIDLNKVQRFLYNVRATPVLWIASDDPELAEVSNVYGFYKDFSTTIAYPDVSMCSLQIEGLT